MKKRTLLALMLIALLITSAFVPSAYAVPQTNFDNGGNNNGSAIWYSWTQEPVCVQKGYRTMSNLYSTSEYVPQDVMTEALRLCNRPFDGRNYNRYVYINGCQLYKSGMVDLPYSEQQSMEMGEIPWCDCSAFVTCFLRDYIGYNIPDTSMVETLWRAFSNNGFFGANGNHQTVTTPSDPRNPWSSLYEYNDAGFRQWMIQEEAAGRLRVGALLFWYNVQDVYFSHVAIYIGGGNMIESSGGRGVHTSQCYVGASSVGKSGYLRYYINMTEEAPKTGKVKIVKSSTNPGITNGNDCYDLDGATYELYDSSEELVDTLVISKDAGYSATSKDLTAGTYTLKETVAPKGYELNEESMSVTVTAGQTQTYTASSLSILGDAPKNDPVGIRIQKKDAGTGEAVPAGDASLAGAEFTVKYYDTLETVGWDDTAERTWIVKTDSDGYADFLGLVSGDPVYTSASGSPLFPIGTLLIRETKAPEGYNVDNTINKILITENGAEPGIITSGNTLQDNEIVVQEQVKTSSFTLTKYTCDFGENDEIPAETAFAAAAVEPSITFSIKDSNGIEKGRETTDSSGVVTFTGLPYGTYTVTQETSAFGYATLDPFTIKVDDDNHTSLDGSNDYVVQDSNTAYSLYNRKLYGKVKVIKIDAVTNEVIKKAGVKFIIKDSSGSQVTINGQSEFVTNENGEVITPGGLPYGDYTIIETATVHPYVLDSTPHAITIDATSLDTDGILLTRITNAESMGKIKLFKYGEVLTSVSTSTQNGMTVTVPQYTNTFLAGAQFEIIANEDIEVNGTVVVHKDDKVDTLTTNATGAVESVALHAGSYTVHESVTPAGYITSADITVTISASNGQTLVIESVQCTNTIQTTRFNLDKLAENIAVDPITGDVTISNVKKSGFVFGLYTNEDVKYQDGTVAIPANTLVATAASDANGEVVFSGKLPVADYYAKELSAPEDRYILDTNTYPVSNKGFGNTVSVMTSRISDTALVNEYAKAWAQIIKVDAETSNVLKMAGFKFDIFDKDGNKVDFVTTNENGVALLRMPLRPDWTYSVVETAVPSGFVRSTTPAEFKIVASALEGELYTLRFQNARTKGKVSVLKKGEMLVGLTETAFGDETVYTPVIEERYLAGAKYELRATEDIYYNGEKVLSANELVATLTTGSDGAATAGDLYLGKYTLQEVYAPNGYILDDTVHAIDLAYQNDQTAVIEKKLSLSNALRPFELSMHKLAETLGTITGSDGYVTVQYTINPGVGFAFGLYNKDELAINGSDETVPANTLLAIAVSDTDGKIVFSGKVPYGEYYVKEIPTDGRYIVNEDTYAFDTKVENSALEIITVDIDDPVTNYYIKKPLVISKTDITGEAGLPGATLQLEDETGTIIYCAVTDESGALDEIELIPGDYTLREISAPNGYSLSSEEVKFTVTEDREIIGDTFMKDDVTRFQFYKLNEHGKPLVGAEFTMYDENGDVYSVAISDENGVVTFENMVIGSYIIKETMAPENYQLCEDTLTLVVTDRWMNDLSYTEGGELVFSLTDHEIIKTGVGLSGLALAGIVIGGVATVGLIGTGVYLTKKRKEEM